MERLLQGLRGLLRLTAVTLLALLGFQVATLSGFDVFFGVSFAADHGVLLHALWVLGGCRLPRGPWSMPLRVYEHCVTLSQDFLLFFGNYVRYKCARTACPMSTPSSVRRIGRGRWAMTFEEILDQAIAMLQRRGRLTYSTLKRQFQLDDAALEDLKNELIEGQRLAVDERGNVLVWTGGADVPQLRPSPPTAAVPLTQGLPPAAASRPPDAERRQLTVMFCDLVASTQLSGRLDPEEYRDVVRAYHTACTAVIRRYDGHIAQLLGDGLLVYFGYPQAHEDDPQRAVRTGLGIFMAMDDLNTRLQQAKGIQLAVRVGIHTGLVVVGAMGGGGRQEQLALGETPNVAAKIQGLAAHNTVAISAATYHLVQGYFACQDLGAQALRGVTEPVAMYRVLQESGARGRLDVAQSRGLTPLVGRESEVTLLLERWKQVKAGHGHVILLTGDA